ncbi:MAG: hypothetical protein ACTSVV_00975 [Promethearchaeota archaeon]
MPQLKCPVCGKELDNINDAHIKSIEHQDALKKLGIYPEDDPAIGLIKLSETSEKADEAKEIIKEDYESEEHEKLYVPSIPEPAKDIKPVLNFTGISDNILERFKGLDLQKNRIVFVNCERCNEVIPIPILKNLVLESELPVVPISYIHCNRQKNDIHNITLFLDHNFDIRRQRISDVLFSPDIQIIRE